jgi:hypothetical protein
MSPFMLSLSWTFRHPDLNQLGGHAQVIDVPVRRREPRQMMGETAAQAARAEGAAYINIKTGMHLHLTQPPNRQDCGMGRAQNQGIRS